MHESDHTELSYLSGSKSSKNLSHSIPNIPNNRECFNGAMTILVHIAILVSMSVALVPRTGNVMDFTLFYVFLFVINITILCIYLKKCCYVSTSSVICIMIKRFVCSQLNVLCYHIFIFKSCKCGVWDT